MQKVRLKEVMLFTQRSIILEGPREMVEAAARVLEYIVPSTRRRYSMMDVTTGDWRVSLEIPR